MDEYCFVAFSNVGWTLHRGRLTYQLLDDQAINLEDVTHRRWKAISATIFKRLTTVLTGSEAI